MPHWESGLCEPCIQQAPTSDRKTQEVEAWTWKVSRNPWFLCVTFAWYFDGDVVWSLFGWAKETLWENIILVHFWLGQFWNGGIWRLRRPSCCFLFNPTQPYRWRKHLLQWYFIGFCVRKPCFRFQIIRHHRKISWFILTLRAETAIENSELLQPLLANSVVTSYGSRSWACRCHSKCRLFGLVFWDEEAQILHSWRIHKHWHECCHWCGANWWHWISWHS